MTWPSWPFSRWTQESLNWQLPTISKCEMGHTQEDLEERKNEIKLDSKTFYRCLEEMQCSKTIGLFEESAVRVFRRSSLSYDSQEKTRPPCVETGDF